MGFVRPIDRMDTGKARETLRTTFTTENDILRMRMAKNYGSNWQKTWNGRQRMNSMLELNKIPNNWRDDRRNILAKHEEVERDRSSARA